MRKLIITLLSTSSVDSLNPIGITQQFILQGTVKKPRHIWYFILTTGVVNMIFGYLVYYGVMTIINSGVNYIFDNYGMIIYSLELLIGVVALFMGIRGLIKAFALMKVKSNEHAAEEEKIKSKIRSVTPLALIGIGAVSTASELTSAFPYFAFLAVLITYKLSFGMLTLILIFYNIIYMAPFMLLYVIYIISKSFFDRIYIFFKKYFKKFSKLLVPLLLIVVGGVVLYDSIANIISVI